MQRFVLNKIAKKIFLGLALILLSSFVSGLQKTFVKISFGNETLDFFYVLFIVFLPQLVSALGYGFILSSLVLLLKTKIFPIHRIERKYLGIKKSSLKKPLFVAALLGAFMFLLPNFPPGAFGPFVTGTEELLLQFMSVPSVLGSSFGYLGAAIGTIIAALAFLLDMLFIKPLYIFSAVRIDALISAFLLSSMLLHIAAVSFVSQRLRISRRSSANVCMEGETINLVTSAESLPLPNISIPNVSVKKKENYKSRRKESFLCTSQNVHEQFSTKEGYYFLDIVPISVFTFPFFHTKVFRLSKEDADVSVIPRLKYKSRYAIKKPSLLSETGSLIKRQIGGSMDFAGLREYTTSDPITRIWWKGLAKTGKLYVKEFQSFAEDRWILALDMTNSALKESEVRSVLQFARLFIELATRKDVSVGLVSFSPSFQFTDCTANRKVLLSALTKIITPHHEISAKGTELILRDAMGNDFQMLDKKCKIKNISMPLAYSASGLSKEGAYFSWRRSAVFEGCTKKLFNLMKKSGKIVLVTDGKYNPEILKGFKAACAVKKYNYVAILTSPDKKEEFSNARVKHIHADYDKIVNPGFVLNVMRQV